MSGILLTIYPHGVYIKHTPKRYADNNYKQYVYTVIIGESDRGSDLLIINDISGKGD